MVAPTLNITNSSFIDCHAEYGGALLADAIIVQTSVFSQNLMAGQSSLPTPYLSQIQCLLIALHINTMVVQFKQGKAVVPVSLPILPFEIVMQLILEGHSTLLLILLENNQFYSCSSYTGGAVALIFGQLRNHTARAL